MAKTFTTGVLIKGDSSGAVQAIKLTQKQVESLDSATGKYNRTSSRTSSATKKVSGSMAGLAGAVRQLVPAMGALSAGLAINNIIQASIAYDGYKRALEAVTGGSAAAAAELKFLRSEAERVGVEFAPLVREFAKLAAAARHTALEGQGVRDTFTAIVEISRVLNLSSEDTRGAIFALQQMISKGTISAEELRRQLGERIPGSFNAMARAVGKNTRQLDSMLKQGQLITEEHLPAFNRELRKLAESGLEAAKHMPAAEFARLKNALFDLNIEAGKNLLPILSDSAVGLTAALKALLPHISKLSYMLSAFAAMRYLVIPAAMGMGKAWKFMRAEATLANIAMTATVARAAGAGAAMAMLSATIAPLVTILAVAGAAWYAYAEAQKAAKEEAKALAAALELTFDIDWKLPDFGADGTNQEAFMNALFGMSESELRRAEESINEQFHNMDVRREELIAQIAEDTAALDRETSAWSVALAKISPGAAAASAEEVAQLTGDIAENRAEVDQVERSYSLWSAVLAQVGISIAGLGGNAKDTADRVGALRTQAETLTDALARKAKSLDTTRDALIEEAEQLLKNKELEADVAQALRNSIDYLERRVKETKAAAEAEKLLQKQLAAGQKNWANYLKAMDPVAAAWMEYEEQAEAMRVALRASGIEGEALAAALTWLKNTFPELADATALAAIETDKIANAYLDATAELKKENDALEVAIANNWELGDAIAYANGVSMEQIEAQRALREINKQRHEQLKQQLGEVGPLTTAIKRSVERLDDAFADFWRSIISGAGSAFDALKSMAINAISEIIHALTTRRLTAAITSAFLPAGTAMAGGTASGGGMGSLWQGVGNFFTSGAGGGSFGSGTSGLTGLAGMFGGNGIGSAFASIPIGSPGGGFGTMFGGGANVANWAYGLAGVGGYMFGNALFPDSQGGLGGSLGATIGTAILPGIGTIVGAALGSIIGGLFKDRPFEARLGGENNRTRSDNQTLQTAFGPLLGLEGRGGWGSFFEEGTPAFAFGEAIQDFDQAIYDMLQSVGGQEHIDAITTLMADWEGMWTENQLTAENVLNDRWGTMLTAFNSDLVAFVQGAESLEEQVQRLGMGLAAQNIVDAAPDLFDGRTWQDFIVVAQEMQEEGEELTVTFQRLVQRMQELAFATEVIKNYGESNLEQNYLDMITADGLTVFEVGAKAGEALRLALDNFDGSAEAILELSELTVKRYDLEIKMLAEIDAAVVSVNSTLDKTIESIRSDLRSPEENYNFYKQQAESSASRLVGMTDPTMIAATIADINRWSTQAWGLLDDEQKAIAGPELIQWLEDVQNVANANIEAERARILTESQQLRDDAMAIVGEIKDPLLLVAGELGLSAEALSQAAFDLTNAATVIDGDGTAPGAGIGDGGKDGPNRPNSVTLEEPIPVSVTLSDANVNVTLDSRAHDASTRALISSVHSLITYIQRYGFGSEVGGQS